MYLTGSADTTRSLPLALNDAGFCLRIGDWLLHILSPYAGPYHYEFPLRGREEASEEKLRRWKREQALFMQRWPEFFLDGDPWRNPNLSSESEFDDL